MSGYIFAQQAKKDLKNITQWIASNNPSAANRFVDLVKQKCSLVTDFPQMGRSYERLAPSLRGFPVGKYIVFYYPTNKGIEVARVLSGYRDFTAVFFRKDE
jgi:toxin ParE1/3/4